jgi:3-polyprenyl-4-hydroxybenzoate decarboxylase
MGIDATRKTGPESGREWGRVAVVDAPTRERVAELARLLEL